MRKTRKDTSARQALARLPDRLEHWPVEKLKEDPRNPRTHTDAQIQKIADSIRRFGFNAPILVVRDGTILAGHGRRRAALLLRMTHVPVIDLSHLSPSERRAYVIADNRLALESSWDDALLVEALEGLAEDERRMTGFDDDELAALLNETPNAEPFAEPPDSVKRNVEDMEHVKSQRRASDSRTATNRDTERYLVVVFRERSHREALLRRLGLPVDERYLAAGALDIRLRSGMRDEAVLKDNERETQTATPAMSGACG